ncbi:hypothetical protein PM082_015761 [Marasmius tenuissimus]|nr:hypothetical protein PM082_015761 [Marasmius tenuissimus]
MLFRSVLSLACLTAVLANPLEPRQNTNTNDQINDIVDALDMQVHVNIPNIQMIQARHTVSDDTIGPEIEDLVTAYNTTAEALLATPVSSGNNDTFPRNDDIGVTFSTALQLTASGLSGLSNNTVPNLQQMFDELDPQIAAAVNALNRTLPGSADLVHIMMLDARQFLQREGMDEALAALGF